MRWEKVEVNPVMGEGPGKRWGHTCNAINGGRFLYIFGGYGKFNHQTNQVHVFDTVKKTWSQPAMKGCPPTARDSHSCSAVGDNLFIFGGTDGINPLKDLHILDTSLHMWIYPTINGEGPAAREGHSAAVVGKRIFIFGGCEKSADKVTDVYYNDLYIFNTETFDWTCATTSGTPPSPRDSHTCSSWKNKIIVIGGEDEHDYYLSDVHILDTDTLVWRELCTPSQLLPPRAGHSAISFGKNLFVFGGFTDARCLYNDIHMLDIDIGIWTKVTTTPNGPSARFSVAGDCLDPIKGGVLVLIGGCDKSLEALDDMYYLYTGIARESGQRPEKLSLRKQLKLKCQEQNINLVPKQVLFGYGAGANISQPMIMSNYSQTSRLVNVPVNESLPAGKKAFVAKVTESNSERYNIETVIDGKPLHGVLFLNKPNTLNSATNTSRRKRRTASETGIVVSNGTDPNNVSKVLKRNGVEDRQEVQGNSSESHENCKEAADVVVISSTPISASASETFKDCSTRQTTGTGFESRGLYYLQPRSSTICIDSASLDLIHRRLGHPSLDNLKMLVPHLSHLKSLDCESCQLDKHERVSFPSSANKRRMSPFDIIYSYVWGPSRVPSTLGYNYYVTFIDDFSRYTWITLLKDRSELFGVFKTFCSKIKTQFGKTIHILRSDNVQEYYYAPFNSLMASYSIIHQSSRSHTLQQNGATELKHNQLVDTARTLLVNARAPLKFWADAVLTACYLINRMPSSELGNKIPQTLLFPKDPLYDFPPRVFGSSCFVHDLSPGRDKLPAQTVKCVFLGYSGVKKGYCCYSPSTHHFHVSTDCTFFEDTPFFASSTTTNSIKGVTHSQVSVNPEPEAVSLNQKNDGKNDSPKSSGENLKNDMKTSEGDVRTDDQTNVPVFNNEVIIMATHDQINDAPNCNTNTDVLKPDAAETESAGGLSNQGATGDCTTSRTEGHSEPEKLT